MSEIFQIGEEASRGKFVARLEALRAQGTAVLAQIDQERVETLVEFERRLSALNGRRQRANRILAPHTAVRFAVSDLLDIDQAQTTATVRADAQAVTLRERQTPSAAAIRTKRFSVNSGTAEAMDTTGSLYRVHTDDGSMPTGTFELELIEPLNLTLLVFDLAAMPSDPSIRVEVSTTGTSYVPAKQVLLNGYRLNAWLEPQTVRFIRIILTPSHPDTLGGRAYTFGLLDFNGSTVEFHLLSELVTRPIGFRPATTQVKLRAADDPGLTYFLAFNGGGFFEVKSGEIITIPGVAEQSPFGIGVNVDQDPKDPELLDGELLYTLPATAYVETLRVRRDNLDATALRVAPGMEPALTDTRLVHKYIGTKTNVNGTTTLYYISANVAEEPGKTFRLTFLTGPAALVTVRLKVQLTTTDRTVTPVFRGAVLEEI